jgi:S-(hydroxymethyl)glutathione dehydrogenase / alcohol dehydrogenase
MRFRAAVLHAVNQPMRIEEITVGALAPSDVLVRVHASSLCHTDYEVIIGQLSYPLPIVLGHEGAGVVEAVGAGVSLVKPGDHVILSWNPSCGRCFHCDRGEPILCEPFTKFQPQGRLLDGGVRMSQGGQPVHHYSTISTHAEYSVVHETSAIKVPDAIPFDRACLIGCGVMTGLGGVVRIARAPAGSSVAVIGCGAVGLNAVQGAVVQSAATIIAIDRAAHRLEMAKACGAHVAFNPQTDDVIAEVKRVTGGRGADVVIECAGNQAAYRLSAEITRTGGQLVWLGKVNVNDDVAFRWGSLMGEKRIIRSSYGGARPRRDFPWLSQLYLDGKLNLDALVTRRIRLDEINDGFAGLARSEGVRTVIEMGR